MEVVASVSQGRTAAAQCGLFTHKSVPVIFEPPCNFLYNVTKWRRICCGETAVGVLQISTSLHTCLATDAILAEGEILQVAVNKGKFLRLQGRTPIPLVSTGTADLLNLSRAARLSLLLCWEWSFRN